MFTGLDYIGGLHAANRPESTWSVFWNEKKEIHLGQILNNLASKKNLR